MSCCKLAIFLINVLLHAKSYFGAKTCYQIGGRSNEIERCTEQRKLWSTTSQFHCTHSCSSLAVSYPCCCSKVFKPQSKLVQVCQHRSMNGLLGLGSCKLTACPMDVTNWPVCLGRSLNPDLAVSCPVHRPLDHIAVINCAVTTIASRWFACESSQIVQVFCSCCLITLLMSVC
jgi:hypothetical protein